MKKISLIISILIIATLFSANPLNAAQDHNVADKVVIYMIDNLTISDINPQNTPYLWSLQAKGGVGLLNTVTGGERTVKNACATISAGKIAVGSNKAHLNYPASALLNKEKVSAIFLRNTGFLPKPENMVVTNIEIIRKNNEQRGLGKPGQLGDVLHSLNLTTAIIGNSDRFDIVDRPGALLLMNSAGIVDYVASMDNESVSYWTDYKQLIKQFNQVQDNEVILVEYGDLTRLEAMYTLLSASVYHQQRQQILSNIDKSIEQINDELVTSKTHSYIITPSPSRNSMLSGALLTPIIIVKGEQSGTLTSYSTRREGVVLLTNLKNSILNSFSPTVKDPIYVSSHNNSYDYLKNLNQRAVFSYTNQSWILTVLMGLLVLLIIIAFYSFYKLKNFAFTEYLVSFVLSIPLVLLFMSLIPIYNKFIFIMAAIIFSLITASLAIGLGKLIKYPPMRIILFLTILTISLDLIFSLDLIAKSIMSYQIIRGARYYGLGNEYMGVLIGAAISWTTLFLHQAHTALRLNIVKLLFALIVFLIAYPLFGVNIGGTITACIALGYTLIVFHKSELTLMDVIGILIGTVLLLYIIALIDISRPFELQSHLGKNINLIINNGWDSMLDIIKRKLNMHIQVLNYNYFGWILLGLISIITGLVYKFNKKGVKIANVTNKLYLGLQGIIIAAIIAIIFNDSGITAAATLFIYFFGVLIFALTEN